MNMDWHQAQQLLTWISLSIGFVGFFGALIYQYCTPSEYDWIEKVLRSAWVWLQFALWSAVAGFVIMGQLGVNFGGRK